MLDQAIQRAPRVPELFHELSAASHYHPLFLAGDAHHILPEFPAESIDCVMTSPPYWGQRDYGSGGIGLEDTWNLYVQKLLGICAQLKRVLKPTGSYWLNIGDAYHNKCMIGLP